VNVRDRAGATRFRADATICGRTLRIEPFSARCRLA
jgi:hypothetical protein